MTTTTDEPQTITIDGQVYPLGRLRIGDVEALTKAAKAAQPPLLKSVLPLLDGLPYSLQKEAIEAAVLDLTMPALPGTPAFAAYAHSQAGMQEVLARALRNGGSDVPREASDAAVDSIPNRAAAEAILIYAIVG